jgi:tetratricopeptide (TPR) repeat protein
VQTARYHYIEAPTPELYDLSVDPAETNNIAPEQTATVGVLKDKLQQILKVNPFSNEGSGGSAPAQPKLNADAAEKLRALGYMAYHSPVSAEALASGKLADPKDKLWEFNTILKATDAFQSGDDDQAKSLLSTVREKDTNMYIVPFLMGETALRRKNWDEAANELKRCLALNPSFDQAMAGLARALINDGKSEEARPWLDKALKINPQNYRVWYELGHLESESNAAAAIRAYEKSIEIQPNFAPVRRDLGMLQFRQRNYPQAAEQLGKAANLGINEAPLFNFLGISYSRTDRLQKAVGIYQRALKLDPDYAEAHLNLGFAYQRLARPVQAKEEYEAACRLDPNLCKLVPAKAAN